MASQDTIIQLNNVCKSYDSNSLAVDNISIDVQRGTVLALLGWSGCGKTTTLRLIAGLERPDSGEVWLNGTLVSDRNTWIAPEKRKIGMVFQDYALFPHMTVEANIAFSIKSLPRRERQDRIREMLELAGLQGYGKRFPHELSGGQQQRVALVRALAADPAVVLLDEPFSNLDAALRKQTRSEVRRILKDSGTTTVFVTHDQEEAMSIADEVAVIRSGQILQVGSPRQVYLHPENRAVAEFVGEANFLPGVAYGDHVKTLIGSLPLINETRGDVDVLLRPEQLQLVAQTESDAVVRTLQFLGYTQLADIQIGDKTTRSSSSTRQ